MLVKLDVIYVVYRGKSLPFWEFAYFEKVLSFRNEVKTVGCVYHMVLTLRNSIRQWITDLAAYCPDDAHLIGNW